MRRSIRIRLRRVANTDTDSTPDSTGTHSVNGCCTEIFSVADDSPRPLDLIQICIAWLYNVPNTMGLNQLASRNRIFNLFKTLWTPANVEKDRFGAENEFPL
jgi:hypothetical protein